LCAGYVLQHHQQEKKQTIPREQCFRTGEPHGYTVSHQSNDPSSAETRTGGGEAQTQNTHTTASDEREKRNSLNTKITTARAAKNRMTFGIAEE